MQDKKIKRIKAWRKGKQMPPYTIEFNITDKCNLKCRYCWQRGKENNNTDELSDDKLIKITKEAIEIGVKEIRLPGSGEPMVRKNTLFKMMEIIKKKNVHGLLITNGTLFDEDDLKKIVELGWDNLTVSVDGPDAFTNDTLRYKEGTFGKIVEALRLINHFKKEKRVEKPKIRFNTVLTNKNYDKLTELIEMANYFNCEDLQLQPMTPFTDLGKNYVYDGSQKILNEHLEHAYTLAKKYGIFTNIHTIFHSVFYL